MPTKTPPPTEIPFDPFGYALGDAPTAAELVDAEKAKERRKLRRSPVPCTAVVDPTGKAQLRSTVSDESVFVARIFDVCGSESAAWITLLTTQLTRLNGQSADQTGQVLSAGLAFLNGLKPQDEVEAALGAQMFATHNLVMTAASRAVAGDPEALEKVISLAAAFAAQMDALGKLRGS